MPYLHNDHRSDKTCLRGFRQSEATENIARKLKFLIVASLDMTLSKFSRAREVRSKLNWICIFEVYDFHIKDSIG